MADLPELSSVLTDRYRLDRQLGSGGMAIVYLAHDVKHARPVAVLNRRPLLRPSILLVAHKHTAVRPACPPTKRLKQPAPTCCGSLL